MGSRTDPELAEILRQAIARDEFALVERAPILVARMVQSWFAQSQNRVQLLSGVVFGM